MKWFKNIIRNITYAQNVVAESDSTKPIALDAVEVLAESKMNFLEVEKSEYGKEDSTEDTKEETEA